MQVQLPEGCGNAPRIGIVNDFITSWAAGDLAGLAGWLSPGGVSWHLDGEPLDTTAANATVASPDEQPIKLEIRSTITHGRLACCEGSVHFATTRADFCHVITFTGAAKTATISSIRSYQTNFST